MTARVVKLFPDRITRVLASPDFELAWKAFPESGRLRSSKKLAYPEWVKAAREVGEGSLLARVRRYAAEDKDHRKECGAPAFHRWLNWGRWEHWEPAAPRLVEAAKFSDQTLRESFHATFKDARAHRWFDLCTITDEREITAPHARAEWVYGPFKAWAVQNRISGIKFK